MIDDDDDNDDEFNIMYTQIMKSLERFHSR